MKKILTVGALATLATPVIALVSCSQGETDAERALKFEFNKIEDIQSINSAKQLKADIKGEAGAVVEASKLGIDESVWGVAKGYTLSYTLKSKMDDFVETASELVVVAKITKDNLSKTTDIKVKVDKTGPELDLSDVTLGGAKAELIEGQTNKAQIMLTDHDPKKNLTKDDFKKLFTISDNDKNATIELIWPNIEENATSTTIVAQGIDHAKNVSSSKFSLTIYASDVEKPQITLDQSILTEDDDQFKGNLNVLKADAKFTQEYIEKLVSAIDKNNQELTAKNGKKITWDKPFDINNSGKYVALFEFVSPETEVKAQFELTINVKEKDEKPKIMISKSLWSSGPEINHNSENNSGTLLIPNDFNITSYNIEDLIFARDDFDGDIWNYKEMIWKNAQNEEITSDQVELNTNGTYTLIKTFEDSKSNEVTYTLTVTIDTSVELPKLKVDGQKELGNNKSMIMNQYPQSGFSDGGGTLSFSQNPGVTQADIESLFTTDDDNTTISYEWYNYYADYYGIEHIVPMDMFDTSKESTYALKVSYTKGNITLDYILMINLDWTKPSDVVINSETELGKLVQTTKEGNFLGINNYQIWNMESVFTFADENDLYTDKIKLTWKDDQGNIIEDLTNIKPNNRFTLEAYGIDLNGNKSENTYILIVDIFNDFPTINISNDPIGKGGYVISKIDESYGQLLLPKDSAVTKGDIEGLFITNEKNVTISYSWKNDVEFNPDIEGKTTLNVLYTNNSNQNTVSYELLVNNDFTSPDEPELSQESELGNIIKTDNDKNYLYTNITNKETIIDSISNPSTWLNSDAENEVLIVFKDSQGYILGESATLEYGNNYILEIYFVDQAGNKSNSYTLEISITLPIIDPSKDPIGENNYTIEQENEFPWAKEGFLFLDQNSGVTKTDIEGLFISEGNKDLVFSWKAFNRETGEQIDDATFDATKEGVYALIVSKTNDYGTSIYNLGIILDWTSPGDPTIRTEYQDSIKSNDGKNYLTLEDEYLFNWEIENYFTFSGMENPYTDDFLVFSWKNEKGDLIEESNFEISHNKKYTLEVSVQDYSGNTSKNTYVLEILINSSIE